MKLTVEIKQEMVWAEFNDETGELVYLHTDLARRAADEGNTLAAQMLAVNTAVSNSILAQVNAGLHHYGIEHSVSDILAKGAEALKAASSDVSNTTETE